MLRAFSNKKSLKFLVKSFLQWVFSLINWNTKPWTKQLLERPQQILANYVPISWRALSLLSFSDLLGKVNKRGPSPFLHSDTNPVLGHILVHSVSKSHFLVVTVESIWFLFFNILCFNFVSTPNKSLRFTRLRRNYVNHTALILNKVTLLFCLMCAVQSGKVPFLQLFVCNDSALAKPIFVEPTSCSNDVSFKVGSFNLFLFICSLIRSELNYIVIWLCNSYPDFTFLWN